MDYTEILNDFSRSRASANRSAPPTKPRRGPKTSRGIAEWLVSGGFTTHMGKISPKARRVIGKVMDFEQEYSDLVGDKGGPTMWGLASNFHPELKSKILNRALTRDEAERVYYDKYYSKIAGLDKLNDGVAYALFKSRVHGSTFAPVAHLAQIQAGLKPGPWGPKSASVVAQWSAADVDKFLRNLERKAGDIGHSIALATMRSQERDGREVVDFTRGFTYRLHRTAAVARQLA